MRKGLMVDVCPHKADDARLYRLCRLPGWAACKSGVNPRRSPFYMFHFYSVGIFPSVSELAGPAHGMSGGGRMDHEKNYNPSPSLTLPFRRPKRSLGWRIARRLARRAGLNQPFGYWRRRKTSSAIIAMFHIPAIAITAIAFPIESLLLSISMMSWFYFMARSHTLRGWSVRLPAESVADLLHIMLPMTPLLMFCAKMTGEPMWPIFCIESAVLCGLIAQSLFWRGKPKSWVRILGSPSNLGASVNTFGQCMDLLGREGCRFAAFRADKPEPEAWARRIEGWLERGETVLVLEPQLREVAKSIQYQGDVIFADDCLLFTSMKRKAGRRMNILLGVFNKLLALVLVTTLWPIGLGIALAIKLDDGGPILFRQERIGRRGRRFIIYKFRTMRIDAPQYDVHPEDGDGRVTRIGRWLRRLSLDEFPQLINVAKGEMRIVGPRPEMPFIVQKYDKQQQQRLRIKPGITGLWQVSPHRNDPIHEHLEYDMAYIAHRGPILDLALVIATLGLAKSTGK